MYFTLAQLNALLAIERHRSFTGAAPALGLTQSAVSRTIGTFERRFGRQLVHRSPVGAMLTATGEAVATHARVIADRMRAIEELSEASHTDTIRVGAVASAATSLVPDAVAHFARRWPECAVLSMHGDDDELTAWLHRGTADLIVTTAADCGDDGCGCGEEQTFETIEMRDLFLAAVPSAHPLAGRRHVDLADLAATAVADPGGSCGPRIAANFAAHGIDWCPDHLVRDCGTVLAMVTAGITSGVIPSVAAPVAVPHGVTLRPLNPSVYRPLYIRYRREHRQCGELARIIADSMTQRCVNR